MVACAAITSYQSICVLVITSIAASNMRECNLADKEINLKIKDQWVWG